MENKKIKEYLLDNEDVLRDVVGQLNSWDGCLDYLEAYENDEDFFETYFHGRIDEAVRAVCYGNYKYTDEYVRFNAYGNLESCDEYEILEEMKDNIDEIIENLIDKYQHLSLEVELEELLEEDDEDDE